MPGPGPVGALTATPYRFRARPWDLSAVETSCTTCAVQCRGALESSSNRLVRLLGVDSDPVNHGWLCDKGRFGYEVVHSEERIRHPMVRKDGELVDDINAELVYDEPVAAVLPAGHPLSSRAQLTLADLAAEAWVLTPRSSWPPWHRKYDADFAQARGQALDAVPEFGVGELPAFGNHADSGSIQIQGAMQAAKRCERDKHPWSGSFTASSPGARPSPDPALPRRRPLSRV